MSKYLNELPETCLRCCCVAETPKTLWVCNGSETTIGIQMVSWLLFQILEPVYIIVPTDNRQNVKAWIKEAQETWTGHPAGQLDCMKLQEPKNNRSKTCRLLLQLEPDRDQDSRQTTNKLAPFTCNRHPVFSSTPFDKSWVHSVEQKSIGLKFY